MGVFLTSSQAWGGAQLHRSRKPPGPPTSGTHGAPSVLDFNQENKDQPSRFGPTAPAQLLCLFYVRVALIKRMAHTLIVGSIKALEFLFAAGLVGSVILILLTSIEDFREV